MRTKAITAAFVLAVLSTNVGASNNVIGASDIACREFLATPPGSTDRTKMIYWVSGRIVAIVPAPVQPFLRKLHWSRLESDLVDFCTTNPEEDLFSASALIAYGYKTEAERDPKYRGDDA